MLAKREPGALQPVGHVFGGNAQPAVGVLLAQLLHVMGGEVGDQHAPAGLENAGGFRQHAGGIVEIV